MPKPMKGEKSSINCLRDFCKRLSKSYQFDYFIMVCILLNSIVLTLTWVNQSDTVINVIHWLNISFNIIFTIEAVVKIYALRCKYFKDSWNIYDFTIVMATYSFLILDMLGVFAGFGSTTTILRALRVGRIIRLIKKAKKLRIII